MTTFEETAREAGRALRALWEGFREAPREPGRDQEKGLPPAGIDGFLSHFIISLEFHTSELAGQLVTLTLPAAVQTVARSAPFVYRGEGSEHVVELPIPEGSRLQSSIRESDFLVRPAAVFHPGKETVWLQILNLDAKGEGPFGSVRIILGETFRREYPDVYQPSFGAAQSIRGRGFPASLFFSPNAVIETPLGALKTRPKALVGDSVSAFPPVGSYPSLLAAVPLDPVDRLREIGVDRAAELEPVASVLALSHPIDAVLLADDPYSLVEKSIG